MKYYVKNDGKIYGPVDEAKIKSKIAEGFFSRECLVSADRIEWTRPISERSGSARAKQNAVRAANAPRPPELIVPHAVSEDVAPPLQDEYPEVPPQRKRPFSIWWLIMILGLTGLAGLVVFLAVDVFLLDRQITSWLWDLLN